MNLIKIFVFLAFSFDNDQDGVNVRKNLNVLADKCPNEILCFLVNNSAHSGHVNHHAINHVDPEDHVACDRALKIVMVKNSLFLNNRNKSLNDIGYKIVVSRV